MSFLRKHLNNISHSPLSTLRRFSNLTPPPIPNTPTSATSYDTLAANFATSGDFTSLHSILNKRIQHGFFNTKHTFNFITNSNFTPSLLQNLITTLSRLNPGFTRRNAFDSLITRLCKLRRIEDALTVVQSMSRVDDTDNELKACTFHPILNFLTRVKSLDQAKRVVEVMSELGVPLDLTAHNYFLMTYCYVGDVEAAVRVLRTMGEEGFCFDSRTYDALVLGACRKRNVVGAMVLVRRMVDDGVPMLYSTHMFVIEHLLHHHQFITTSLHLHLHLCTNPRTTTIHHLLQHQFTNTIHHLHRHQHMCTRN